MFNFSIEFQKLKKTLLGTTERPTALRFLPSEIKKTIETGTYLPKPIREPIKKVAKFLAPESVESRARKDIMRGVPSDIAYQTAKKKYKLEQIQQAAFGTVGGMENVGKKAIITEGEKLSSYLKSKVSTTLEKEPFWQTLKENTYSGLNKLYTATIDRFNPINQIAKKATGKILPGENPELLARRYLGVKSIAESKIFWKTTKLTPEGNLEITGEGLSKILKPIKNNLDDLRTLMVAERDLELAGRGGIKGTTPKESQEVIDILKKGADYPQLQKTAQEVRNYAQNAILDPLHEVGAISDETYNLIRQSNQFYTPFKRVMEEIESQGMIPAKTNLFTPKGVPLKAIKGSEKAIIDPLESLISDTYKVTDFVERERVGKAVVNLRNQSPELAEMINPIHIENIFKVPKNTIQVFENGARKFYQVSPELSKAMNGMSGSDMGVVMKILAFPTKTLRAGATLTPEFIGRNPIRDQFSAFVYSKYGYNPPIDFVKGIWETVGRGDLFQRWLASGGDQSMFVSLDRISNQQTLLETVKSFTPQRVLLELKKFAKGPLEPLRALSTFGEKGTRVGAFKQAVRKGVSDIEAAFESRDITLDFSRLGSQTKAVNQIIAFWNANVQGIDKLARAFKERPIQTSFKAIVGITLPSVSLYLLNRNDPRYQEIPQWQKDLFWIIPVGKKGPIIRIPKPFELGIIFGTVPEHILTWIDKNDPEALTTIPSAISKAASPGFIPTALLPILENTSNYSFFRDRPIVSQSVQNLPPGLQASTYTSETAKEIGKIMNYSPAKIENLAQGYFGGLANYVIDASDEILKALGIVSPPTQPSKTLADIPGLKGFIVREPIGSSSESVNKFYNIREKATQAYNAAKDLADKGNIKGSTSYLKEHKEALFYKGLNKAANSLSDIRKAKEKILMSNLNPDQKKRAIDALDSLMTEIAKQVLIVINEQK